ncbi:hypothetical protein GCM10008018_18670 [Paenibacillus marchantiophytorum]|uniref:eCIS core domain-containing protein n=1 Tax=Paenibacillus marchantiophytorum TaxID=1619310 RepID=A0ABQ2BUX8_9BACL|nr:DUF4157 domain-containing protein [Paenibacillus marchantiophytorum]GGI46757.1 hypothetical protein GCM10008018_18670 [Paenibacillus marchantiophytorum]
MPMHQSRISRHQDTSLQNNHRSKSNSQGQSQDLMNIQQTIGNKAVCSMLSVQTKLTVGPVGDAYEQEADQVGKQVADRIAASESSGSPKPDVQRMESEGEGSEEEELQMKPSLDSIQRMESSESEEEELQMKPSTDSIQRTESEEEELQMKPSTDSIQRTESEEEELQMKPSMDSIQRSESEEEELQMKPSTDSIQRKGGEDEGVDDSIESQIKSKQGNGSKMDGSIQAKMESAFNKDFSNVNIHNDSESTKLSASLGAEAFATGNDIFFREGRYNPDTHQGQELLGHELTHVVQQRGGQ